MAENFASEFKTTKNFMVDDQNIIANFVCFQKPLS